MTEDNARLEKEIEQDPHACDICGTALFSRERVLGDNVCDGCKEVGL